MGVTPLNRAVRIAIIVGVTSTAFGLVLFAPMGPASPVLFVALLMACVGMLVVIARARRWVLASLCGLIVIVLAMLAGIVEVNRYYGYYHSWSALLQDLSGAPPDLGPAARRASFDPGASAIEAGELSWVRLPGQLSHLNRAGLIYLPPQYHEAQYAKVRFPLIELIHGSPGLPTDWYYALQVQKVLNRLIAQRFIGPAVAVMPAMNPNLHTFQDCVNSPRAADDTYLAKDVPTDVRKLYRVSADPAELGIGGYSSGGYCAANLALRHRTSFGAAAIMDGYFRAIDGPAGAALHHDAAADAANSPLLTADKLHAGTAPLPAMWVSAGTNDRGDYETARAFVRSMSRLEQVTFAVAPGGGHNFYAWARLVPRMLPWLWQQVAPPQLQRQFPLIGGPNSVYVAPNVSRRASAGLAVKHRANTAS